MVAATKIAPQPLIGGLNPRGPRISCCIDWIALTLPNGVDEPQNVYTKALDTRFEATGGIHGYTEGRRYADGRIMLKNANRPEMGVHWIFAGSTLNNLAEVGCMPWHILKMYLDKGCNMTRLDLAIDCKNTKLDLDTLENFIKRKDIDATCSKFTRAAGLGDTPGHTIYIGSRQSERFARFYDKAAEQSIPGNWIRLEIELKADRANFAAKTIVDRGSQILTTFVPGVLRSLIDFPSYDAWNEIMRGEKVIVSKSQKHPVNTRKWLLETVASTLGRLLAREGDDAFWFEFQKRVFNYRDEYERRLELRRDQPVDPKSKDTKGDDSK